MEKHGGMYNSTFKQKTYEEIKNTPRKPQKPLGRKKLTKRQLMPSRIKSAKKRLVELSHGFVRKRDSFNPPFYGGNCCTCGKICEGSDFQAGHYEPDSTGGALLRYHPRNMHGQGGFCCNINRHGQQKMGNDYTLFMIKKYGLAYVEKLRSMKKASIRADIFFFEKLIELYEKGDEQEIVNYLESLL